MAKFQILVALIVLSISAAISQSQNYEPLQPPMREYLPPNRGQGQRPAQSQQRPAASAPPQAQSYASAPAQPPRSTYLPPGSQSQPQSSAVQQQLQRQNPPAQPPQQAPPPQTYASASAQQPPRSTYLPPGAQSKPQSQAQEPQRQSTSGAPAQPSQQRAPQPQTYASASAQQPPRSTYLPPGGQSQSQPQSQAQQYQPQRQSAPPAQPPQQQQPQIPQPQAYASASAQQPPQSTYLPPGQGPSQSQQQPQRQRPQEHPRPQQRPQGYSSSSAQQPPRSTYLPPSMQQQLPQSQPAQPYNAPTQQQQSDPRPRPNYASASAQSPNSGAPPPKPVRPVYGLPGHTPGEPLGLPGAEAQSRSHRQSQQCPPNDNAGNKALVMSFYQEVIGDKNFEAVDKYLTESYINHNPMIGDGREVFKQALGGFLASAPRIKIDFRRISAEDDLVWVHTRATNFGPMPEAVVDIFRIECGLIAEHWDVMQPITENGPNPHAFF